MDGNIIALPVIACLSIGLVALFRLLDQESTASAVGICLAMLIAIALLCCG